MAWRRPGDMPLSEPRMESLLTHICVTRIQWVKSRHWWVIICPVRMKLFIHFQTSTNQCSNAHVIINRNNKQKCIDRIMLMRQSNNMHTWWHIHQIVLGSCRLALVDVSRSDILLLCHYFVIMFYLTSIELKVVQILTQHLWVIIFLRTLFYAI